MKNFGLLLCVAWGAALVATAGFAFRGTDGQPNGTAVPLIIFSVITTVVVTKHFGEKYSLSWGKQLASLVAGMAIVAIPVKYLTQYWG